VSVIREQGAKAQKKLKKRAKPQPPAPAFVAGCPALFAPAAFGGVHFAEPPVGLCDAFYVSEAKLFPDTTKSNDDFGLTFVK